MKKISKKEAIKKSIYVFIGFIILAVVLVLLLNKGNFPFTRFLIILAIMLPFGILGWIIGYKYCMKKKFKTIFFLIGGASLIIMSIVLILIGEGGIIRYINIGLGLIVIFLAIRMMKKKK